jgi:hypothetical protein
MALETDEQRQATMLFQQAIAGGITIMGFMLVSTGALRALGSARPGANGAEGPSGGDRRWRLIKPPQAQLARGMVGRIRAAGKAVIVNIGGEGEEVGAINVNIQRRLKTEIENLVEADAADMGHLFDANSVDKIVSNHLPPNTLNWVRIIPAAHKCLKGGGRLIIRFRGAGEDGKVIMPLLKRFGFKEINDWGGAGAVFEAVK